MAEVCGVFLFAEAFSKLKTMHAREAIHMENKM